MLFPGVGRPLEAAITPLLALLLYVTFLGVPFRRMSAALRDVRFLLVLLALNFVAVPAVVFALSRFVAHDAALLLGVLLVLLTPCVDYVIVFARLAGGAADRLLAATPVLMVGQIVLLPAYLWAFAGTEAAGSVDPVPILWAFLWLIVLPLVAAIITQILAIRRQSMRALAVEAGSTMVPLMMLTLAVVVASQIRGVAGEWSALATVVPIFVTFAGAAVVLGVLAGRVAHLGIPEHRAVLFSGVTRNSLVVLPLALAAPFALTPLVVVTQTLIELVVMVILVAAVPRLIRG